MCLIEKRYFLGCVREWPNLRPGAAILGGHFFSERFHSLRQHLRHHFFRDALVQQPVYPRRNLQVGQAQSLPCCSSAF